MVALSLQLSSTVQVQCKEDLLFITSIVTEGETNSHKTHLNVISLCFLGKLRTFETNEKILELMAICYKGQVEQYNLKRQYRNWSTFAISNITNYCDLT